MIVRPTTSIIKGFSKGKWKKHKMKYVKGSVRKKSLYEMFEIHRAKNIHETQADSLCFKDQTRAIFFQRRRWNIKNVASSAWNKI